MVTLQTSPSLRQVFLRLVLLRLFLPLMVIGLSSIGGIGYFARRNLEIRQYQIAKSIAQIVDYHLDQGGRILDAVAGAAENSTMASLTIFMKSTWQAYSYFETLYYLNEDKKVKFLMPFDPRYVGLDMSNLHVFQQTGDAESLVFSHPFISLRTGDPTVYLVKALPRHRGCIVGELNLGLFQKEITSIAGVKDKGSIFIMDQSGTLLAHPNVNMVRQQVNLSNLEIFHRGLIGQPNTIYRYQGTTVLGSAVRVGKTGWVVVDQVPLAILGASYAWILGLILITSLAFWWTLAWALRKQIQHYVIGPLEQLSCGANALTAGDFDRAQCLSSITPGFAELNQLIEDFQSMSSNLQVRETALQESEECYRGLFDRVPLGLFSITRDGYFMDINPAALLILGYPNHETLMKVNFAELLYPPSGLHTHEIGEEQASFQWKRRNFETQIKRYDGTIIWVKINTDITYGKKDDQQSYYEGSLEDITMQKQVENALQQEKDKLELLVEQRTEELVTLNKELKKLSSMDSLTGVANRRYFDQFLTQEWQCGMGQNEPISIIMLDIDFFKEYNDDYGHQAGDDCLRQVAGILKNSLKRASDLVARYGGEEFIAVLPDTKIDDASALAEEIRANIESLDIRHKKSPAKVVTVSAGVASMISRQGILSSALIETADQELYKAKRKGRNRVSIMDSLE